MRAVALVGVDGHGDHQIPDPAPGLALHLGQQLPHEGARRPARGDHLVARSRQRAQRLGGQGGLEPRHERGIGDALVPLERGPTDERRSPQEHEALQGRPGAQAVEERAGRQRARPPRERERALPADRRPAASGRSGAAPRAAAGRSPRPSARDPCWSCRDRAPSCPWCEGIVSGRSRRSGYGRPLARRVSRMQISGGQRNRIGGVKARSMPTPRETCRGVPRKS